MSRSRRARTYAALFNQGLHREALDASRSLDAYVAAHIGIQDGLDLELCRLHRDNASDPVARAILDHLVADKTRHAAFGWFYLESRAAGWNDAERHMIAAEIEHVVRDIELKGFRCVWLERRRGHRGSRSRYQRLRAWRGDAGGRRADAVPLSRRGGGALRQARHRGGDRMIDPSIDAEYNIRKRHPESPQHYARYEAESAAARAALGGRIDLRYGKAPGETLDFFPATRADAPLFLFIHGGYWRALDKRDFSFIAPPFVAAGIAVALINYDLCPKVTVETIVAQTCRAIGWTHGNSMLPFNRQRLIVGGHSAGGHLTAMALAAEPRLPIAAGIAISGVFDLEPLIKTNVNEQIAPRRRARRGR